MTCLKKSSPCCVRQFILWSMAFTLVGSLGCSSSSDEPVRYPISGKVTFHGEPVPLGEIFFQPDSDAGNSGPASSATIVDSKYSLPKEFGTLGGAYKVSISGFAAPGGTSTGPLALRGAPLFPDYVTKVELTKGQSEQNFDVPAPKNGRGGK